MGRLIEANRKGRKAEEAGHRLGTVSVLAERGISLRGPGMSPARDVPEPAGLREEMRGFASIIPERHYRYFDGFRPAELPGDKGGVQLAVAAADMVDLSLERVLGSGDVKASAQRRRLLLEALRLLEGYPQHFNQFYVPVIQFHKKSEPELPSVLSELSTDLDKVEPGRLYGMKAVLKEDTVDRRHVGRKPVFVDNYRSDGSVVGGEPSRPRWIQDVARYEDIYEDVKAPCGVTIAPRTTIKDVALIIGISSFIAASAAAVYYAATHPW